jgi:zinc transporter ZupT
MNYLLPLFSVLIGYVIALFLKPKSKTNLKLLLAFSGSFLLSLTVMHLLPDVYESHDHNIGLFIMVGILFQIILEFFSKGAEHGHVHGHEKMYHIPWLLFISLCIHAFLEGFPVSHHHNLAVGIAIHHLPIAIILTLFFVNAKLDKKAIFAFMLTFAVMTPLGTIISDYLPLLNDYYTEITAVVIGILFHISSTIIFESSEGHKFNVAKVSMIIFGVVLAYFI